MIVTSVNECYRGRPIVPYKYCSQHHIDRLRYHSDHDISSRHMDIVSRVDGRARLNATNDNNVLLSSVLSSIPIEGTDESNYNLSQTCRAKHDVQMPSGKVRRFAPIQYIPNSHWKILTPDSMRMSLGF